MIYDSLAPVLVQQDTIYQREDHAKRLLLFQRPQSTASAVQPFFMLGVNRPSNDFFLDRFVSVYPVIEAYALAATPPNQPFFAYQQTRPNRIEDLPQEDQFRRVNQQKLFSYIEGIASPDFLTYSFTIPDLCDDPWLEQVHRPLSPEAEIFPFRQIYTQNAPNQIPVQMFYQAPNWKIEAEMYTVPPELASKLYPFRQIYVAQPLPPVSFGVVVSAWTADSGVITADTINFSADGADLINGGAVSTGGGRLSNDFGVPLFVPVYGSSAPTTPLPVTYPAQTYYINGTPKKSGQ